MRAAEFESLCDRCGTNSPDTALCNPCAIEWERLRDEYAAEMNRNYWEGDQA